MFYGPDNLQDVIYNFNFPNESECINKEMKKNEQIHRISSFQTHFPDDEMSDRVQTISRYRSLNKSQFYTTNDDLNSLIFQMPTRNDTTDQFPRRNVPPPPIPPKSTWSQMTNKRPEKSDENEVMLALVKLGGPNMLVDILRRHAALLSSKINVSFKRSMRKDEVINWYKTNWKAIKPFLHEIKPDSF